MTVTEVFILSDQTLDHVVSQIKPDQWALPIPEWFQVGRTQTDPDLKTIINYHAYDEAWIPDTLAGKTIADIGDKFDGDLLGEDPAISFHELTEKGIKAAKECDLDKTVHLTYGDFPAHEYLRHIISFRGFRAYDIAKLIGADTKLPTDLVHGMWELLSPDMDQWRKIGVYQPAVNVPASASEQDRLIALSGRQP